MSRYSSREEKRQKKIINKGKNKKGKRRACLTDGLLLPNSGVDLDSVYFSNLQFPIILYFQSAVDLSSRLQQNTTI
jgi:hypothetical protein